MSGSILLFDCDSESFDDKGIEKGYENCLWKDSYKQINKLIFGRFLK